MTMTAHDRLRRDEVGGVHGREELLRPADVCRWLQVSRTWLYAAAKAGRIPSHRLGGDGPLRFKLHEVEAWIDAESEARARDLPTIQHAVV